MAFRFIHTGDLHLDSPLTGLTGLDDPRAGEIALAPRKAFETLVDKAIALKVDAFLIAGDLWDGDWRDVSAGLFVQSEAARLKAAGIAVFAVLGNHDAASEVTERIRNIDTLHLFGARRPTSVQCGPAVIHGVSYETREELGNLAVDFPTAVPGRINIGLLHTSLDGRPGHAPYAPCTPAQLAAKGYHYWALGHVHTRDRVREAPPERGGTVAFCGVLQGRHIRETGIKGALLVEIDGSNVRLTDIDIHIVGWHGVTVDVSGGAEPKAAISLAFRALEGQITSPLAPVRVTLVGETAAHHHLLSRRRALLEEARFLSEGVAGGRLLVESVRLATTPPDAPPPPLPSRFEDDLARAAGDQDLAAEAAAVISATLAELGADVRAAFSKAHPDLAAMERATDARPHLEEAALRVRARMIRAGEGAAERAGPGPDAQAARET